MGFPANIIVLTVLNPFRHAISVYMLLLLPPVTMNTPCASVTHLCQRLSHNEAWVTEGTCAFFSQPLKWKWKKVANWENGYTVQHTILAQSLIYYGVENENCWAVYRPNCTTDSLSDSCDCKQDALGCPASCMRHHDTVWEFKEQVVPFTDRQTNKPTGQGHWFTSSNTHTKTNS